MSVRIITIPDTDMVWIDLQNPSKEEQQEIAAQYKLDLYAVSDSVEPSHLPKFEEQSNMNFLIVRMQLKNAQGTTVNIHQISSKIAVFYTDDFLITIHRGEVPFIDEMIEKYINTKRLRTITSIVVKLLRKVLLSYEEPLLQLSDEINKFEENMLLKKVQTHSLQHLFYLKNKANLSKKLLILTDDILDSIEVKKTERSSLQDIKDLHVRLVVLYDQFLDEISSLQNIYISISAQRTNEVMKTLTIFSMFFLPLTFVAGIYGMNFQYMPELQQRWGYPVCLGLMVVISLVIYLWFKHKKWL